MNPGCREGREGRAAPRAAGPAGEAGAGVRSSSSDSRRACSGRGPPGRCCLGSCHLRGAHFPWSNHLQKRLLWSESQGQGRAGRGFPIVVRRFPGRGWGTITPRAPAPKQLSTMCGRNRATASRAKLPKNTTCSFLKRCGTSSHESRLSSGKAGVSEVLSTLGFDGLANSPQSEGIGGPRPVKPRVKIGPVWTFKTWEILYAVGN